MMIQVQFGHAGSSAHSDKETAVTKNKVGQLINSILYGIGKITMNLCLIKKKIRTYVTYFVCIL